MNFSSPPRKKNTSYSHVSGNLDLALKLTKNKNPTNLNNDNKYNINLPGVFFKFFSKPVILCLSCQKLSEIDHSSDFTILMANTDNHPVKVTSHAQMSGSQR